MPVHGSHAWHLAASLNDANDNASNFTAIAASAENPSIAGVWFSLEVQKNFKQAIRLDSIKHRKPTFGATPQRHHVMPCGRLPNALIHGNLLMGWADILCV